MVSLPTLKDIYTAVRADYDAEFGVNISTKKKVALRAFAAVQAGRQWLQYKVLGFVIKNIWPDTADVESKGGTLERFGRVKLGRNPRAGVAGQYTVEVTGQIGATIPAQRTFKSKETSRSPGMLYILDAQYVLTATTDSIVLRALTPGTDAKLDVGDELAPTSPIANVDSIATVTAETVQPLAAEAVETYRAAVVSSFRLEPQGGSPSDYRLWAQDAQGVARVYPYFENATPNGVKIFVEATEADSTDGKGTPGALILADVGNVIDENPDTTLQTFERGRRPINVIPNILAVTIVDIDIEITGSSFTASQQTQITDALTAAIKLIRPFIPASDALADKNDVIDTNKINGIIYSQVPGAVYTGVVLKVNTAPVVSHTFTGGDIPYVNSVTFP